ncbi:MAG: polymer-forming cytoskeletal protein [Pseudomonadota bacterium]|jgi:cytoskeletal protein CcmA (bactofilin family)|uniref:bactofilin family protein n=1 Tax=Burkholderiaceae TaxID=119060 RepID=UPI0010F6F21C|nr:polymer-forming cytoskeletal protein [Burkholderia sp. 4M9327F10]
MNEPGFLVRVALGVGLARRAAPAVRMQSVNDAPAPAPDASAQPRRAQPAPPAQHAQNAARAQQQALQQRQEQASYAQQGVSAAAPSPKPAPTPKPALQIADGLPARGGETDISTVIPAAAQLNGDLEIEESIVLQCVVRGNVTQVGDHQVVLTSTGGIHGTLRAHTAVIGGTVEGDVFADRVVVLETGHVNGNVEYTTLAMKEGGTINGTLTRIVPNVVGVSDGGIRVEQPGLRAVSVADQERVA